MTMKNKSSKDVKRYTCLECKRNVGTREFYSTKAKHFSLYDGYLPFCKNCVKAFFLNTYRVHGSVYHAILSTCMKYSIPYSESAMPDFEERDDATDESLLDVFNIYMKLINGANNRLADVSFNVEAYSSQLLDLINKVKKDKDEKLYVSNDFDEIEVGEEEIAFFGNGFTREQYKIMTKAFLAIVKTHHCTTSLEPIFKDLAFLDMQIEMGKKNSMPQKELMALMDGRRKLYKDADIDLSQRTDDSSLEGIGAMIRKFENEKPIMPLKDWDDNKLEEISTLVSGQLKLNQGIEDEVTEKFKETIKPYSIDLEKDIYDIENEGEGNGE